MATKPTPGGSDGTYGTELNAFLDISHNADGTQKALYIADGTTVFNTTLGSANTFQDLDINAQVGANVALCFFKVTLAGASDAYAMKPKGDAATFTEMKNQATNAGGTSVLYNGSGTGVKFTICSTDSSGIIEHAITANGVTVTIVLVGYIK